jgi:hypothetical protein
MAYGEPDEDTRGNRAAGFILVFMMLIIIGIMIYVVVASKNPGHDDSGNTAASLYSIASTPVAASSDYIIHETGGESPIVAETGKPTGSPAGSPTSSPEEEEPASPSPTPTSQWPGAKTSPVASPTGDDVHEIDPSAPPSPKPVKPVKPKKSPKPAKLPAPKPSPAQPEKPEPAFEPPKPDGPPNMDRMAGSVFEGKTGKVEITIYSKALPARTFLIDVSKKVYWDLKLKPLGSSRFKAEFPPGNYRLKIVKSNYFSFDEAFEVTDGDKAEITEDPMMKRPSLNLSSTPPGARIIINGGFAGVTPKVISGLNAVEYNIVLKKKGFKNKAFKVALKPGQPLKKSVELSQ